MIGYNILIYGDDKYNLHLHWERERERDMGLALFDLMKRLTLIKLVCIILQI